MKESGLWGKEEEESEKDKNGGKEDIVNPKHPFQPNQSLFSIRFSVSSFSYRRAHPVAHRLLVAQ